MKLLQLITVTATLKTDEVRWAYQKKYAAYNFIGDCS